MPSNPSFLQPSVAVEMASKMTQVNPTLVFVVGLAVAEIELAVVLVPERIAAPVV